MESCPNIITMKNLNRCLILLLAALLLPTMASAALNAYLQIKDAKGSTRIVHVVDGTCTVEGLAPGTYSLLVCDEKGTIVPSDLELSYAVLTAREAGSGMATGRRQHSPIRITKKMEAARTNEITVNEEGVRLVITAPTEPAARADKATKMRSNIQNN